MATPRINVYLVCGGKYHDFDFARLEILKLLAEHDHLRVKVGQDFHDVETIRESDCLVTYTCDVVPTEEQQKVLHEFVNGGKKWFALHGTNSILKWLSHDPPLVGTPREAPLFMEILGSQFLAHPAIEPYTVEVSSPDHPLVQGIEPFETTDELYLSEHHGECCSLLHTTLTDKVTDFEEQDWELGSQHMVFYTHPYGEGEVLYLTLGHCRSTYDMQPLIDEYPVIERGSWELPVFYELMRRGIRWGVVDT